MVDHALSSEQLEELLEHIEACRRRGIPDDDVFCRLARAGWTAPQLSELREALPDSTLTLGFVPAAGLRAWLGQAWRMLLGDVWAWVGASLLLVVGTKITFGWAGPALLAGLFVMALKRARGERLRATDLLSGLHRFWSPWALVLPFYALIVAWGGLSAGAASVMPAGAGDFPMTAALFAAWYSPLLAGTLLLQAVLFYAWPLVAQGTGGWEAMGISYARVRPRFWSYVGVSAVLAALAWAPTVLSGVCWFVVLPWLDRTPAWWLLVVLIGSAWCLTFPLWPCATVAAYRWHFAANGTPIRPK